MLEQMIKSVTKKIIAQEYPHAKSPSVIYATVSKATQIGDWNEYTLIVVDRWGNEDESFPPLPGVRSKEQYKPGAFVAVAMAYGDSPAIIGEVQL